MKHYAAGLILAAALLCAGCSQGGESAQQSDAPSPAPQQEVTVEKDTPETDAAPVYDDNCIEELYGKSGKVTIEEGGRDFTLEYTYRVPALKADTAAAQAINADIQNEYGKLAAQGVEAVEKAEWPDCANISWKSYWHDSLVCLVVQAELENEMINYGAYNYDFATGQRLSNQDLLARLDTPVTPDEALAAIRRAAAAEFDGKVFGGVFDQSDALMATLRQETLSDRSITMDGPMYIDENGRLAVVAGIGVPAGGGVYVTVLYPEFAQPAMPEGTLENGFVSVRFTQGRAEVIFTDTEESHYYLPPDIKYGVPYPIDGLYGQYTDGIVGVMGQDFFPYLFLRNTNGQAEYCNLMACAKAGYFCAGGPLPGVREVESFQAESVSDGYGGGYQTVFAQSADGQRLDLTEAVFTVDEYVPPMWCPSAWNSTWGDNDLSLWVQEDFSVMLEKTDKQSWDGRLTCLGMNQSGLVFSCELWNMDVRSDGPAFRGAVALEADLDLQKDEVRELLRITPLSHREQLAAVTGTAEAMELVGVTPG